MEERKHIEFTHSEKGTLLFTINDVSLPKRIRDTIDSVSDSRFNAHEFKITDESISTKKPLFFEWQKIDLLYLIPETTEYKPPFSFTINKEVQFQSKNINGQHPLSGSFNLKNHVGLTNFCVRDVRGQELFKLDTEVYPQKLEYKEDFQIMIYEITKIIYNLIYDYLKKTYANTQLSHNRTASLVEWRAILEVLFDSLEKSLDHIIKNPKSEIKTRTRVRDVSKVKRASRNVQKWILRNQRYLNQDQKGVEINNNIFATHIPEARKRISNNTFENRFVLWAVKQILSKLDELLKYLQRATSKPETIQEELKTLKLYRQRLRRKLALPLFREVEDFENQFHFSTVLTMASGYKDFYHKYLMLRKALSVFEDDQFKMDYKDIATLYEYWCFLKIVDLLKRNPKYQLVSNDLIKVKGAKFIVSLKQGIESKFVFKDIDNQEEYELYFNRSFTTKKSAYTYNQRPDYSIQFKKKGYDNPFWYVLDAKYRFNRNDNKEEHESSYDAPDDAIGQLHRYRDAILHNMTKDFTYKSAIKNLGGLILYPYPKEEETFKGSKYHRSIEQVNIGAMPFAPGTPGKHKLFEEFLDQLFNKTPESLHEEIVQYDVSNYDSFIKKLKTICVIGLIKEENYDLRKTFYLSQGVYNVRFVKNPNVALYKAEYIALYSPVDKSIIGYAPIKKIEIEEKEELEHIGVNWNLNQDRYALIHFDTNDWKKTNQPFDGKQLPRGYRYTNLFAFEEFQSTGDINAMNLNDFSAIRLWKELRIRSHKFKITRGKSFRTIDDKDKIPMVFKIENCPEIKTDPKMTGKKYYFQDGEATLEKIIKYLDNL